MADIEFDVIIAAYLIPDLAQQDFGALVDLVGDKQLEVEGVALVTVAPDGTPSVQQSGDHLGRKGFTIGGGNPARCPAPSVRTAIDRAAASRAGMRVSLSPGPLVGLRRGPRHRR